MTMTILREKSGRIMSEPCPTHHGPQPPESDDNAPVEFYKEFGTPDRGPIRVKVHHDGYLTYQAQSPREKVWRSCDNSEEAVTHSMGGWPSIGDIQQAIYSLHGRILVWLSTHEDLRDHEAGAEIDWIAKEEGAGR